MVKWRAYVDVCLCIVQGMGASAEEEVINMMDVDEDGGAGVVAAKVTTHKMVSGFDRHIDHLLSKSACLLPKGRPGRTGAHSRDVPQDLLINSR